MARSIGDWFDDHADGSLGDRLDDEVVERQAPWDLQALGRSTARADRRTTRSGTWPSRRGAGGQPRPADRPVVPAPRGPATSGSGRPGTPRSTLPAGVQARVRQAAETHPGVGYKQLARTLKADGLNITRAQVADVLAHPNSGWKRKVAPAPLPRKPATVFRLPADAQRSRIVPATDLCPSCEMRLTLTSTCRCS